MRMRTIASLVLAAFVFYALDAAGQRAGKTRDYRVDILKDTFGYGQAEMDVAVDTIFQGCPVRDCIPSVDAPVFKSAAAVDYLDSDDLLLSVVYRGQVRAYPTRFLDRHEIVNDEFGGVPVAVTYCPLCGSGLAFLRTIGGQAVEFGVSGMLHNNDLIMYDRRSGSLWQQITGTAFAGPMRGRSLEMVPVTMSEWGDWKGAYPGGEVLSLSESADGGVDADLDGKPVAAHCMYWFAWYSFNPDTALIAGD